MSVRSGRGALATMALAFFVLGCSLLKKKNASGDDAGDGAVVAASEDGGTAATVAGSGAKNEGSVGRFANETPLSNEPGVIGGHGVAAHTSPGGGAQVAFLAAGTAVTKIATHGTNGVLVLFDDPKGDGSKLIGWVSPNAFDTGTARAAATSAHGDAGPVKDAGSTVDAGSTTKDAGTSTADAGGGGLPPQPKKGTVSVQPNAEGKCPENWAITQGMCRRKCGSDKECDDMGLRNTKCKEKDKVKVCTSD